MASVVAGAGGALTGAGLEWVPSNVVGCIRKEEKATRVGTAVGVCGAGSGFSDGECRVGNRSGANSTVEGHSGSRGA